MTKYFKMIFELLGVIIIYTAVINMLWTMLTAISSF